MQYAIYDENVYTQIENEELYTKGIMLFFLKKKKIHSWSIDYSTFSCALVQAATGSDS